MVAPAASAARLIFTEPAYWAVLRPIIYHCVDDYCSLSQTCRNLRHLVTTDPDVRDRCFNLVYSLPAPPPSLDGPLSPPRGKLPLRAPNIVLKRNPKGNLVRHIQHLPRPSDAPYTEPKRTPQDTERYLREQSLQRFSPSLIRCVHTRGPVAAVRDGYMVTLKTRLGGTQPTGWTVWALPPWFEVQQTVLSSSSGSSKAKASIPVKDVCMPPRPAGASNDQNVWMWDYSIGQDVAAVAIQPDENLVAVAVQPITVRYSKDSDKGKSTSNQPDSYLVGRRHRIYFYQLRPTGLGHSTDEWGVPIKHPNAARPYVDLLEPDSTDQVAYKLKVGPNGLVGLLVAPQEGGVSAGPLAVWNWQQGVCVGLFATRAAANQMLDFDFFTSKHVIVLEAVSSISSTNAPSPGVPPTCYLTVLHVGNTVSRNANITYRREDKSATLVPSPAHNCWTVDDGVADAVGYLVALELPALVDQTEGDGKAPALTGSVSLYPPLSDSYYLGTVSFTISSRGHAGSGTATASDHFMRGALSAAVIPTMVSPSLKKTAITDALSKWHQHVTDGKLDSTAVLSDKMRYSLCGLVGILAEERLDGNDGDRTWDEVLLDDFRLANGSELFTTIVHEADEADLFDLGDASPSSPSLSRPTSFLQALGGEEGVERHAAVFSKCLDPLVCKRAELVVTEFASWKEYAHIETTATTTGSSSPPPPPPPGSATYASRVLYLDPSPTKESAKHLRWDTVGTPVPKSRDGCSTLTLRNYSLGIVGFPPSFNMDAAKWFLGGTGQWDRWHNHAPEAIPAPPVAHDTGAVAGPRHVTCSDQLAAMAMAMTMSSPSSSSSTAATDSRKRVHGPWIGTHPVGSAHWYEEFAHEFGQLLVKKQPNDAGDAGEPVSAPYTEARLPVFCDVASGGGGGGVDAVWFDGQTVVLAQADTVTLISF